MTIFLNVIFGLLGLGIGIMIGDSLLRGPFNSMARSARNALEGWKESSQEWKLAADSLLRVIEKRDRQLNRCKDLLRSHYTMLAIHHTDMSEVDEVLSEEGTDDYPFPKEYCK